MNKVLLVTLHTIAISQFAFADARLKLARQPLVLEEGGLLTRYSVQTERNEFHFLPPADWRITLDDAAQKIVFTPRDGSVQLTFKILWATGAKSAQPDVAALRTQILERYLDAKITEEFTAHTSNESGPAFDLTYATAKNFTLASRVAFIPFSGGIVEFELTTRPENFLRQHLTFGNLLNSFEVKPGNRAVQSEPTDAGKAAPQNNPVTTK